MTNEELKKIMERHAAAMVNYPYQDAVVDDIPALVAEVERLNTFCDVQHKRIQELESLIDSAVSNTGDLLSRYSGLLSENMKLTTPVPVKKERTLVGDYRCPRCDAAFIVSLDEIPAGVTNFCGHCGQSLDWSQTNYAGEATPYSKNEPNLEQENPYSKMTPENGITGYECPYCKRVMDRIGQPHKCRSGYRKNFHGLKWRKLPITRGDRIRQMIDEELAEWLQDLTGVLCPEHCLYAETNKCNDGACVEGTLAWLRQPEGE